MTECIDSDEVSVGTILNLKIPLNMPESLLPHSNTRVVACLLNERSDQEMQVLNAHETNLTMKYSSTLPAHTINKCQTR
jgi:hypothetical protein